MFVKWLTNNGNTDLFELDSVSKFTLTGKSIVAYDTFVSTKQLSIGVFKNTEDAMRVFNKLVDRINVFNGTDDASETDIVFDVLLFLDNGDSPW